MKKRNCKRSAKRIMSLRLNTYIQFVSLITEDKVNYRVEAPNVKAKKIKYWKITGLAKISNSQITIGHGCDYLAIFLECERRTLPKTVSYQSFFSRVQLLQTQHVHLRLNTQNETMSTMRILVFWE